MSVTTKQLLKIIFGLLVIFILASGGVLAWRLTRTIRAVMTNGSATQDYLVEVQTALQAHDFTDAQQAAQQARQAADQAYFNYQTIYSWRWLPVVGRQIEAGQHLIVASQKVIGAVLTLSQAAEQLSGGWLQQDKTFAELSDQDRQHILANLFILPPALQGAKAQIDLASLELQAIPDDQRLIGPLEKIVTQAKDTVPVVDKLLGQSLPLLQAVPYLAGYGQEKTYLFIFQNNTELRPTGGFWGTYGLAKIKDGKLISFTTDDIYSLDGPAEKYLKVTPPPPLAQYLNKRWYLRDANWWPDFPTSARQAIWFYGQEKGVEKIDGIIALDPQVTTDLLKIIGDLQYEDLVFNPDNFVDLLEYEVEIGFTGRQTPVFDRKSLVGKLASVVVDRLHDLPLRDWASLIDLVNQNIDQRHLMFYDQDPAIQDLYSGSGWSGEVLPTVGDYLMVIDANMGSLKTDRVVDKNIDYKIKKQDDKLLASLTLNYQHQQAERDYRTSRLRTYTRVYVPLGSQLIEADRSVDVTEENGKTVFGFLFDIYPAENKSATLQYSLPSGLVSTFDNHGAYDLLVQKQAGTTGHDFSLTVEWDHSKRPISSQLLTDKHFTLPW